jgi:hypothetical protein
MGVVTVVAQRIQGGVGRRGVRELSRRCGRRQIGQPIQQGFPGRRLGREHAEMAHEQAEGAQLLPFAGRETREVGEAVDDLIHLHAHMFPLLGVVRPDGGDDIGPVKQGIGLLLRAGRRVAGTARGLGAVVVDHVFFDEALDGGFHDRRFGPMGVGMPEVGWFG